MKHSWHIERIITGRSLQIYLEAEPRRGLAVAARAAGVSPRRAKRILKYLEAHGAEPAIPEFGTLKHKDVIRMGFTGIEAVRSLLIRNHSAAIGLSKKTPRLSNKEVAKLADACGFEHFLHNGLRVIHWRYGG